MINNEQALESLYRKIFDCRLCAKAVPSVVPRVVNPRSVRSPLVLAAQAPSEQGVRVSGRHWVGDDGRVRPRGGAFLDKHLRRIGYTVDWNGGDLASPYTTNVMHCFPGSKGSRDRKPGTKELRACKQWWLAELEVVRPKVVILLSAPAASSFGKVVGDGRSFRDLLTCQGEMVDLGPVSFHRFVLPHPTAPYRWSAPDGREMGKDALYEAVFDQVAALL